MQSQAVSADASAYDPFAISGDSNQLIGGNQQVSSLQPVGSVEEWYRNLVTSNSGIFYEDGNLQVDI